MTQEEKDLLIKDLCARLTYGVRVKIGEFSDYMLIGIDTTSDKQPLLIKCEDSIFACSVNIVKPYLRPMSSMTDDEREDWYRQSKVDYDCEFKPEPTLSLENCHLSVDWLNKKGFDYRGLIPMGLALEAKEGMYKTK